ncbi:MAG: helix-turn-helix domain-containing protein [Treponema sp.]|nr:helix-turn-helix domain-containing protein [Treponema sp.]
MGGQEVKTAFGKNIKFLRSQRQFSQAELAERADISITFLSNIERGLKFPKPEILYQIATGLEVEIYELFIANHVPKVALKSNKELINCISRDMSEKVSKTIESVFKKYLK